MNAQNNAVATIEERIDKSVTGAMTIQAGGLSFHNATEVMEYAKMMSVSGSAVPKHLRGQPGACLGIIDDAIRFGISPYALARKSYFVNDNLAYEAQVIAAVMLKLAPLAERPDVSYTGEGTARKCVVTGKFTDGKVQEYKSPQIGTISPKNSPLWKTDPDQQLAYYSLRAFGRRHCPDVILGMYDPEEMAAAGARDVTPQGSGLAARLKGGDNGFSAEGVGATLDAGGAQEGEENAEADHEPQEDDNAAPEPSVDWNDAAQATEALDRGDLPEGFSINEDGALVIPDDVRGKKGGPRGHSILAARFDEIVTVSGEVVKAKAGPEPEQDLPADDDFPGDVPFETEAAE